jgi:trigger factor
VARIPGFRPGKAPVTLIRRRFAEDIQGEVVQSLVPEYLEKALDEKKLVPVTRPEVDKVEFKEGEPLKFRAFLKCSRSSIWAITRTGSASGRPRRRRRQG